MHPARDVRAGPRRCWTTTRSGGSRPRPATAGRYLGVGISQLRRADDDRDVGYYGTEGATIRIEPSGKVNVYVAGGSTGNSLETTAVQLAADALGVDIADVHTIQGDTAVTPFGAGTGGSRSGSMIAGAVGVTAARSCAERIIAIAAAPAGGGAGRHRARATAGRA